MTKKKESRGSKDGDELEKSRKAVSILFLPTGFITHLRENCDHI